MANGFMPREQAVPPDLLGAMLQSQDAPLVGAFRTGQEKPQRVVDERTIGKAIELLTKYKQGKSNLEQRIVEDELWWELRHWEVIRKNKVKGPEPSSAWLFNAIANKHADAMDNYPEPIVLPRESSDEQSAKTLSAVLPVVLEYNDFEQTYSDNWWEKLKHGTAAYGVFWNSSKENGLGDIDIKQIDLLKLFWEPGVTDIQKSRNLFIVDLVDEELLDQQYPEHAGKMGGSVVDVKSYLYDDTVDTQGKSVVVDWYYKVTSPSGQTILHYAKFVGDVLLFASENEPEYRGRGWYDHGMYPVVLDVLYPEKGTPVGFGYVAVCKDPQLYIDKLSGNIMETSMMGTKRRWMVSESTNINEKELEDWTKPLVHVAGELSDARVQEIAPHPLDSIYVNVLQMKIEEMKDTASNRDVNSGGAGSGVTAAAAISALQEAGNKSSRDMIAASYRAHASIVDMCVELIRQFYDEVRAFRVVGSNGQAEFVDFSNAAIRDQVSMGADGIELYRRPVFDLKIKAQKKNPFSRMEQNERAKELYSMGFFDPNRAQEAMGALEMMDFEGIEKVRERVEEGQTLMQVCQQLAAQVQQLSAAIGLMPAPVGSGVASATPSAPSGNGDSVNGSIMQAQTPMTSYGDRLAKRSAPDMNAT